MINFEKKRMNFHLSWGLREKSRGKGEALKNGVGSGISDFLLCDKFLI